MMTAPPQDDYSKMLDRTRRLTEEVREIAEEEIARYRAALARQEAEQEEAEASREGP